MINCVVAIENGQGIGFDGNMPWPRLKDDMVWFKTLTTGHVVIMGSTTWNSLPKPLPNRVNMVISRNNCEGSDHRYLTPDDALDACKLFYPDKEIFIIGGQALYDSTMHMVDRFYITEIDQEYTCDKYFNVKYVKQAFPKVTDHGKYTDPIPFVIREYNK
jgi:dihydrofolate reductase